MSRRASVTRHRLGGVATATVSPAWVSILAPQGGSPQIVAANELEIGVSGFVEIPGTADVNVGDFLYWSAEDRWFQVLQMVPLPVRWRALVAEISAPLPDEFALSTIESWWMTTASGFVVLESDGALNLTSMPAGTLPSQAKGCYQLVAGDFDVWARLRADAGSGGNIRYILLGARHPTSSLGIYIGMEDDGVSGDLRRLDEYAVATLNNQLEAGLTAATYYYVRLKRSGGKLRALYNTGSTDPATEAAWTEADKAAALSFNSADPLRVGLWGYTNNSTAGEGRWQFLRNWAV